MHDGRLIVCTEAGEIILCETDGSYMSYIPESPIEEDRNAPFKIESITPFSRGFIVSGKNKIYAYEKTEDQRVPYRLITRPIETAESPGHHFMSTCLSQSEDYLYCVTKQNQLKPHPQTKSNHQIQVNSRLQHTGNEEAALSNSTIHHGGRASRPPTFVVVSKGCVHVW